MTILLVEDEGKIREFVKLYLLREGYEVLEAADGHEALRLFDNAPVHLVILDIMMPGLDGFAVSEAMRTVSNVPIIMLTALESEDNHVKGYELGADDYVTKPFKIKVLLAKIKRLLASRESLMAEKNLSEDHFVYEGLSVDFDANQVTVSGQVLKLTPKEYGLLAYLIQNRNIVLSRAQILEHVWGYDFEGGTRVVDNHIKKLRRHLGKYSLCIETVVSVGYKFILR